MKVRYPLLFKFSILLLVLTVASTIGQLLFLSRAERGTGVVRELQAENARCKRSRSKCTMFKAVVEVQSDAGRRSFFVDAGDVFGHDRPLSSARYRIGDPVPVVFDPNHPGKGYRDGAWDIWKFPIALLTLQVATLVMSMFNRPRRRGPEKPITLRL